MHMLVRIPTKADTRLWLQKLYNEADEETEPGLRSALQDALWMRYQLDVIGSVAADTQSKCIQTGICEVANEGCISIEGIQTRAKRLAESDAQIQWQEKFKDFTDRVTRTRLRAAGLEDCAEQDVVTTVIPMCSVCWAVGSLHMDHIIPKSKGGLNDYTNYQLLCAPCNSSKNDKDMDEWHAWVNTSEDAGAEAIRERRAKNRALTLPKGGDE